MAKYIDVEKLKQALLQKSFYPVFVKNTIESMPAAEVIPIEVVENYLDNIIDEWDKLGRRKYELANMQVFNHIRKEQDDLAEWREKNV